MALEQGLHQVLEYFLGILPASRQITALARTASGLDRGLQQACAYRGLPLAKCLVPATTELNAELRKFCPKRVLRPRPTGSLSSS
ncbi:hypothetical protein E2320_002676 [Naja naja]|nr:hypothetical protein E2320_002676 [Naja naja]